jgi:hypothetical protein
MSYEMIKSINIDTKNKKVFITSYSNNVVPKTLYRGHAPYYDKYFENGGVEAIQKEILFAFFSREFQGSSTHYGKCMPSFFNKYDRGTDAKYQDFIRCGDDAEFRKAFLNRLYEHYLEYENKRKSKDLFHIKVGSSYIMKVTRGGAATTSNISIAKTFNRAEAEITQKRFSHASAEIIQVD